MVRRPRAVVRAAVDTVVGMPGVRSVVRQGLGPARMVLVWHRVSPHGPGEHEVVPALSLRDFEAQLDFLCRIGDVVPLSRLDAGDSPSRRPRFALTFDDDDPGHARWALPALRARDLPATFFLSGRWLTGRGPYWWEVLEARLRHHGVGPTARDLGLSPELTAPQIGARLTGTQTADELAQGGRAEGEPPMSGGAARELVSAGFEIGFHTRDHESLPSLEGPSIAQAVSAGRGELAEYLDVAVKRFAYPHGHVDRRCVDAVRQAGYVSAWTTTKKLVGPADDPMSRGRWDLASWPLARFRGRVLRALRWAR